MAISTYALNADNNPLTDTCTEACSSGSTVISGLQWTASPDQDDSGDDSGTDGLVWGELAPSLYEGECENVNCAECRMSHYDYDPDNT